MRAGAATRSKSNPVEVEHVAGVVGARHDLGAERSLARGQPQLRGGPVEVVVELGRRRRGRRRSGPRRRARPAAVPVRGRVGPAGRGQQPGGVGRSRPERRAPAPPTAATCSVAAVEGRCSTRVVGSSCGQARQRRPLGAVHAVERHARERVAGGHQHPQHPVELPPALLCSAAFSGGRPPRARSAGRRASSCHGATPPLTTYLP